MLPDEQGVVLRFGKFVNTTQPGLNYHIPFPVESVITPKVTKVNRIDIGFRSERDSGFTSTAVADVPEESLMLTGDENIVDINYSVFWVIKDAGKFLFNILSILLREFLCFYEEARAKICLFIYTHEHLKWSFDN